MLAAIGYVRHTASNATTLLMLGELGRRSANPKVVQDARNLIDSALRLRIYSLLATCRLFGEFVFPDIEFAGTAIIEQYETLLKLGENVVAMHRLPHRPSATTS